VALGHSRTDPAGSVHCWCGLLHQALGRALLAR